MFIFQPLVYFIFAVYLSIGKCLIAENNFQRINKIIRLTYQNVSLKSNEHEAPLKFVEDLS